MKKRLAFLLAVLLLLAAVPSAAPARAESVYVRVLLSTEGAKTIRMGVTGGYWETQSGRYFSGGSLTVAADGSTVTVRHSTEGVLYSGSQAVLERADLRRDAGALRFRTRYGERSYLGNLIITAKNSVLSVVNSVPMQHYLYGVVGHEMADSWPLEALKAQAIAGKCYALLNLGGGSYDIGDTSSDQVYKGYTAANTNVIMAVDTTLDAVLLYNGQVMRCYYAASNGGYMLRPSSNWSGKPEAWDAAYSEGPDAYDMRNPMTPRETVSIPVAFYESNVSPALYAFFTEKAKAAAVIPAGYSFQSILSVDGVETARDDGTTTGLNHKQATVRLTVNAVIDKVPEPTPTPEPTATIAPTAVPTDGAPGETPAPEEPEVLVPPEAPAVPLTVAVPVTFSFALSELTDRGLFSNEKLRIVYAEPAEDGFQILHARYGHGVGMSQRGAQVMATEGKTYAEILLYYYSGATLGTTAMTNVEEIAPEPLSMPPETATGTTANEEVHLRKGSSSTTASLARLPVGTPVRLFGLVGDWYRVEVTATGQQGYVHKDYVQAAGNGAVARGKVNSTAVNLRTGPGLTHETTGKVSKNTEVAVLAFEGDWYRVRVLKTGKTAYISRRYVTVTQRTVAAPGLSAQPTATPENEVVFLPADATPGPTATPAPTPLVTPTPVPTPSPSPTPAHTPSGAYMAEGRITGSGVNLRSGASTSTGSLGKLAQDTPLGVYEKVGAWYRVRVIAAELEGYVYGKYVSLTPVSGAVTPGAVNTSRVNLRTGPGTSFNSLGRLDKNTKVEVLGSSGSWVSVRVPATGAEGYIFSKYVTVTAVGAETATTRGIATALCNLRSEPAVLEGKVLTTVPRGAVVTVRNSANGWCYITYNGTTGYCLAACIQMG